VIVCASETSVANSGSRAPAIGVACDVDVMAGERAGVRGRLPESTRSGTSGSAGASPSRLREPEAQRRRVMPLKLGGSEVPSRAITASQLVGLS